MKGFEDERIVVVERVECAAERNLRANHRCIIEEPTRDFDIDDRPCEERPKTFKDAGLEALLHEDPCQTQQDNKSFHWELSAKQLLALGLIQKQGTWVPCDLKLRDVERRFLANPKKRKSRELPGHASTSSAMLRTWWDQVGVIYYELLTQNETITRLQLMRLRQAQREKRPQYEQRHEKVILQNDNVRLHVAKHSQMGSPTPRTIFPRYCAVRLSVVPFGGT
ncbi:hypothetical protein Trydic_g10130 [Trypoxylus dichotomus]